MHAAAIAHGATITIVQKTPPAPGKKQWKILAETGESFGAFPPEAAQLEEGCRYTIGYTSSDFQGRTYHTVKSAQRVEGGRAHMDASAKALVAPAKSYSGNDPRQIFVCAIVKEWVPAIPVGETSTLVVAIQSALDAYDQTFGGKAAPAKPEYDDDIPL